jgi:hypothetical protein
MPLWLALPLSSSRKGFECRQSFVRILPPSRSDLIPGQYFIRPGPSRSPRLIAVSGSCITAGTASQPHPFYRNSLSRPGAFFTQPDKEGVKLKSVHKWRYNMKEPLPRRFKRIGLNDWFS